MNIELLIKISGRSKLWALGFKFKTEAEALEAVKQDGDALQYVNFDDEEKEDDHKS